MDKLSAAGGSHDQLVRGAGWTAIVGIKLDLQLHAAQWALNIGSPSGGRDSAVL